MKTATRHTPSPRLPFVWLASYPRSGNTLLRTILWNCFGLQSGSVYPNDLGKNRALEETVGHIEHVDGKINFPPHQQTALVKTHEHARDDRPAIYVVRDGRSAVVSLWDFYDRSVPLKTLIEGHHQFGTWQDHLLSWTYSNRPHTLFLRYESLTKQGDEALDRIASFLGHEIITRELPQRSEIADADGRWVRPLSAGHKTTLEGELLDLFFAINAEGMARADYR